MSLDNVPIGDLFSQIPSDIVNVTLAIFAFFCILALWRTFRR